MKSVKNFRCILKLMLLLFLILVFVTSEVGNQKKIKAEVVVNNKYFTVNAIAEKEFENIEEDIYAVKATFKGDLTGYAADCPMCNGTLACKSSYDVYKNGVVTFVDKTYGTVRIVASSKNLPCGSIIRFNSDKVASAEVYAIVLDRGGLGTSIDLLVETELYASKYIGRSKIDYDVVRFGW